MILVTRRELSLLVFYCCFITLFTGCTKQQKTTIKDQLSAFEPPSNIGIHQQIPQEAARALPQEHTKTQDSLDFEVKNETGKTIFVTCFYYLKKQEFNRWRWDKSDVLKLETNAPTVIHLDPIKNKEDREGTYGYLCIFDSEKEAQDSTYELTPNENKIDLDLLYKLKHKTVKIQTEKYGFKKEKVEVEFITQQKTNGKPYSELDFQVENQTGKALYVSCFIYQKKPNMPTWEYSKLPVQLIQPNETITVDVSTIKTEYERIYMRGYLGVFNEQEKKQAEDVTFEFLKPEQKINLGLLSFLGQRNQKVVLSIEKYGIDGDFIDFVTKPIQNPLKNRR